ncbi:murein hydrolase activator EnvC family protein [Bacillus salitolerans]|uniref:Murein hydrolase activator EnvC family protein n=1 Tax=Bacillus salitolerans TaxID=1437434 RepID=A0ABW4LNW0_9BACI
MKRRLFVLVVVFITGLSGFISTPYFLDVVSANTKSEIIQQKKEVDQRQSELQQNKENAENEIAEIEAKQQKLYKEIERLDLAQAETGAHIREKQEEIKVAEEEIQKLELEIVDVTERIEKRNELLKERVRSLQVSGGVVQYLDVVLGAQSFSDFIDRVNAVTTIFRADKEILQKHEEDKLLLEQKQAEMKQLLQQLGEKLAQLENLLADQQRQSEQKEQLMKELQVQEEMLQEEIHQIEDEEEILKAQEAAFNKELERIKKREEEERRKNQQASYGGSGNFIRPSAGPVTSNYGQRWGRLHAGVDIGKRGSNVPVVAAADGTVIRSYYSSSYGNVVFIAHSVKGQIYTTVYAHLENREVSDGQSVQQGQRLGYMGNTGHSFGAHLHFELHKGGWNESKSNSVDPRKYINF